MPDVGKFPCPKTDNAQNASNVQNSRVQHLQVRALVSNNTILPWQTVCLEPAVDNDQRQEKRQRKSIIYRLGGGY
jgi:hypothetical protein